MAGDADGPDPGRGKVRLTVLVYVVIVVLFRFTGKRGLANLNTFDFVVIFLLSNVVQSAIIGNDTSLLGGVIGAVTLVAVNAALNRWLGLDPHAARVLEGTSTTVIKDGKVVERSVKRLALRSGKLGHAVRTQTGGTIKSVTLGRLEPDGRLVVVPRPEEMKATRADIAGLESRLAAIEHILRSCSTRTEKDGPSEHGEPTGGGI